MSVGRFPCWCSSQSQSPELTLGLSIPQSVLPRMSCHLFGHSSVTITSYRLSLVLDNQYRYRIVTSGGVLVFPSVWIRSTPRLFRRTSSPKNRHKISYSSSKAPLSSQRGKRINPEPGVSEGKCHPTPKEGYSTVQGGRVHRSRGGRKVPYVLSRPTTFP